MKGKTVDDFIKYVKEQFDYDIILNSCKEPDSFASVFGASFLEQESVMEPVKGFDNELQYECSTDISVSFYFDSESGMNALCVNNLEWAA